jgi:hypothetical protein
MGRAAGGDVSERRSRAALPALVVGYAVIAFGAMGLLRAVPAATAGVVAAWVLGADLLHDLVVAPLVCVTGFAFARLVPRPWSAPVRIGSIATAVVLVVAYPVLRGFGRHTAPGNGSVLPLDYTTAVLTVLGVVWGLMLVWAATCTLCARANAAPDVRSRVGTE